MTHAQTDLTTFSSHHSSNWDAGVLPGAMAAHFVGATSGWIIWVFVFEPFFTGILKQFIGFCYRIGKGRGGKGVVQPAFG